jgi:CMP-N,N'-diacetyllegionaminic acid synthase
MYQGKKVVALIPARGGSKRLPGKNIRLLAGKPLIVHSIEQALASEYIDEVYITSDSDEILKIGERFGAKIIKRQAELASDTSTSLSVMKHAVNYVETVSREIDVIVLLQPTTPLRKVETINKGIKKMIDADADSAIGVSKRHLAPNWIFKREGDYIKFLLPNYFEAIRSQDQPETYEITGGFYAYKKKKLMGAEKYALGEKIVPVVMDKDEIADIDDLKDFDLAEAKLKLRKSM